MAIFVFLVFMAFFDENNFIERVRYQRDIDFLIEQKRLYIEQTRRDSMEIDSMKHNIRKIEKTAREKYGMKSPDEDIFIVIDNDRE